MDFLRKELITSQKQAAIKLFDKKDLIDKRFIKNWRSTSLVHVNIKQISKYYQTELKTFLPNYISSNQNPHFMNRFITEMDRLISDIFKMSDNSNIEGDLFGLRCADLW